MQIPPQIKSYITLLNMFSWNSTEVTGKNKVLFNLKAGRMLFIGMGQSNLVGLPENLPYTGAFPTKAQYLDGTDNTFKPLVPGAAFRSQENPAIHMFSQLERAYPNVTFYYAEVAIGGEGFKSGAGTFAVGNPGRLELIAKIKTAVNLLAYDGTFYYGGLIVNQGEAETFNDADVSSYASQLSAFITEVRSLTAPTLPRILTRVSKKYTIPSVTRLNSIRNIIRANADVWVNTDDLPIQTDNRHQTATGYAVIGRRYFDAIRNFKPVLNTKPYVAPEVAPPPADPPVEPPTDPPADPPPTAPPAAPLDLNFRELLELPASFETAQVSPSFGGTDGLTLVRTGPEGIDNSGWGENYAIGPVWDKSRPLQIYYKGHASKQAGVGVAVTPKWYQEGKADSLIVIRYNTFAGFTSIETTPTPPNYTSTKYYRATFTVVNATDVRIEIEQNNGGTYDPFRTAYASNLADLDGARIMLDSYAASVKVQRIVN